MKKNFVFILVFFISFNSSIVFAQDSDENVILNKLLNLTLISATETSDKYDIAIENAIEIFKNAPSSLESYYALYWLLNIKLNDKVIKKFNSLKTLYFSSIDIFDSNQPEKLVLIALIGSGVEKNSLEEANSAFQEAHKFLIKAQDTCTNKDYLPLIKLLMMFDPEQGIDYANNFKAEYPNHPWLPFIDLIIVGDILNKKDYQKCINTSIELIEKYKNIKSPYGWKIIIDYYNLLTLCYLDLKDTPNIQKYFQLIKTEAPNYFQLKNLENAIRLSAEIK